MHLSLFLFFFLPTRVIEIKKNSWILILYYVVCVSLLSLFVWSKVVVLRLACRFSKKKKRLGFFFEAFWFGLFRSSIYIVSALHQF